MYLTQAVQFLRFLKTKLAIYLSTVYETAFFTPFCYCVLIWGFHTARGLEWMWRRTCNDHDEDIETAAELHSTRLCYMSETYTSSQLSAQLCWQSTGLVCTWYHPTDVKTSCCFFELDHESTLTCSVHKGFGGICRLCSFDIFMEEAHILCQLLKLHRSQNLPPILPAMKQDY